MAVKIREFLQNITLAKHGRNSFVSPWLKRKSRILAIGPMIFVNFIRRLGGIVIFCQKISKIKEFCQSLKIIMTNLVKRSWIQSIFICRLQKKIVLICRKKKSLTSSNDGREKILFFGKFPVSH